MKFKSLIYSTKYGKDFGKWTIVEAQNKEEAIKKCDSIAIRLCHGKKDAIAYTKPIAL